MKIPDYSPVEGKTYTLFGDKRITSDFYEKLKSVTDQALELSPDPGLLIDTINRFSSRKKYLRTLSERRIPGNSLIEKLIRLTGSRFSKYTEKVEDHLKTIPLSKLWDRRLATTREQYHLYLLEIELTNRLNREKFRGADRKIALLPYCLQYFSVNCKATKNEFDFQCKHCSGKCFQNFASDILAKHNIEPYIWMAGNMKQLARYTHSENRTLSVLGIACIPELLWGMRNCRKNNIPVVGLPLNANRCRRWFGEFYPNSVDLSELEKLISA